MYSATPRTSSIIVLFTGITPAAPPPPSPLTTSQLINVMTKIKGTSLGLKNYIVSSIKYKAVLMTEIQTANENVRQCLEYLCEQLNNVGTKLH